MNILLLENLESFDNFCEFKFFFKSSFFRVFLSCVANKHLSRLVSWLLGIFKWIELRLQGESCNNFSTSFDCSSFSNFDCLPFWLALFN